MNIKELRTLIEDLPDDLEVMFPVYDNYGKLDGFMTPCPEESQPRPLNNDDDFDDSLVLVPCGFFDEPVFEEEKWELN